MSAPRVRTGDAATAEERVIDLAVRRWKRLEEDLLAKLMDYSRDVASEAASARAYDLFWGEAATSSLFEDEASFARFLDWFVFDYRRSRNSRRLIERFRDHAWDRLSDEERLLLTGWLSSRLGIFEVLKVDPGRRLLLSDIFTGERVEVTEKTASQVLHKYDLIFTRPLRVFDTHGVSVAGLVIPRSWKRVIEAMLRYELGRFRRWYPGAGWEEFFRARAHRVNRLLVSMILDRSRPRLHTASGEPLLISRAWYQVCDPEAVVRALARVPGCLPVLLERDEAGGLVRAMWNWCNADEAGGGPAGRLLLGDVRLANGYLTLSCLSRERLEQGKKLLARGLGGAARHRVDEYRSAQALLPELGLAGGPDEEPMPPEVAQAVQRFLNNYYRRWVDEPLPALGGDTPREACRTREGRSQVLEILKLLENLEEKKRRAGKPYIEVSMIRRELGLPEEE